MRQTTILSWIMVLTLLGGHSAFAQTSDFGDAPDPPYPTLLSSGGADHIISPLFLGSRIDAEFNGQPNAQADGDDLFGGTDDEDGILFSNWLIPGQNATITVTASASGKLDAWIDFQPGGTPNWSSLIDQIFTNQAVSAGKNTFTFAVPAGATTGKTFGRFRLSTIGGLTSVGPAADGEVEDYQILIGPPSVGNTVMDPDPGLSFIQNEISMEYLPGTGRLIAAYNDIFYPSGPGIGVSYSTDNGATWTSQNLALPPNTTLCGAPAWLDAFDPSITSDNSGNIYLAHITTDYNWGSGPVSGLYVHKSTNGGVSWGTPYAVDIECGASGSPDPAYRFNDRCQITVDKTSGTYAGNIYVAWIKDRGWNVNPAIPPSDIYVSVSTNAGVSFSSAKQINATANNLGNMPVPAVAANGDLYVLWMHYNVVSGGSGTMYLDKSTDGGLNWGTDVAVGSPISLPPINLNGGWDARAKGAAVLRTHPTNSNTLYIVYAASAGLDEGNIYFIKSTNGGTSWSSPLKINDDATTTDQVLPWMEVAPNGLISVAWYDRRNDPLDLSWDVYASTSNDGGTTFATNTKINTTSFTTPQTAFGAWFGEYLGLAMTNATSYVGFASSAIDAKGDVLFTSFSNPPPLPIELINFEVRAINNRTVEISWQTASETNNDLYIVERSKDGFYWEEVTRLDGGGNTSTMKSYIAVDEQPFPGISYYRLEQVDFDGSHTFSPVRAVEVVHPTGSSVRIYPNPFKDITHVYVAHDDEIQIEVFDHLGKLILSKTTTDQVTSIDMNQYSSGVYFIKALNGREATTQKVIKY